MLPADFSVLFIHGAGGGSWEWKIWQSVFMKACRGCQCVVPTLMASERGIANTTLEDYIAQLDNICSREVPSIVIGASMGGWLALKLSGQYTFAARVLINPLPSALQGINMPAKEFPEVVNWSSDQSYQKTASAIPDADDGMIEYARTRWRDESGQVLNDLYRGKPLNISRQPTLVVIGEDDTTVPAEISSKFAVAIGADRLSYSGVSHVGPLLGRHAEKIADDCIAWLAGNCGIMLYNWD